MRTVLSPANSGESLNSVTRRIASQILEQKGPVTGVLLMISIATAGVIFFVLCLWGDEYYGEKKIK